MPDLAFKDLCFDVTAGGDRAAEVVSFWSTALGQAAVAHEWGDYHLDPPPGGPRERTIWVNNVPEAPAGKSRVHLDLRLPDGDPAPLVAAGARIVRPPTDEDRWYVLEDPDGIPLREEVAGDVSEERDDELRGERCARDRRARGGASRPSLWPWR